MERGSVLPWILHKLYAPQDFPDKEGFFRTLSALEQKQKLDEEVQDVEIKPSYGESDKMLTTPEQTDTALKVLTRSSIVLAEDLALREIESEFGVSGHPKGAREGQVEIRHLR